MSLVKIYTNLLNAETTLTILKITVLLIRYNVLQMTSLWIRPGISFG